MKSLSAKNMLQHLALVLIIFSITSCRNGRISLHELMQEYSENGRKEIGSPFSGAVLIAKNGKVIFKEAYGLYDRSTSKKNKVDTKFPIGSITKQFTAMLILLSAEEGLLSLNDTLATHLPYLTSNFSNKITIHQLLSHTSGLPHYDGLKNFESLKRDFGPKSFSPKELALIINDVELIHKPGTAFHYSSLGYMLLGVILEKVNDLSYAQLLDKKIVKPLNLKNTGYANNEFVKNETAKGYSFKEDETFKMIFMKYGGDFFEVPFRDQSNTFSTGGIHSTVEDLFIWSEAIKKNKLLPKKSTEKMLRPNLNGYCYGWIRNWDELIERNTNVNMYTHGGTLYGHRSSISIYDDETTIIYLSNVQPIKEQKMIHKLYLSAHNLEDKYELKNYPEWDNIKTFESNGGFKALNNYFDKLSSYCGYKVLPSDNSIMRIMLLYYEDGNMKIGDSLKNIYYKNYPSKESDINRLGYHLLNKNCSRALSFFKENTIKYPNSANAWDSLGEGYLTCGNHEKALLCYKKAVEIAQLYNDKNIKTYKDNLEKVKQIIADR